MSDVLSFGDQGHSLIKEDGTFIEMDADTLNQQMVVLANPKNMTHCVVGGRSTTHPGFLVYGITLKKFDGVVRARRSPDPYKHPVIGFALNVALRRLHDARLTWTDVKYIASAANPADEPSRGVSVSAAKLLEHLQQLTSVEGVGGIQLPVTGLVAHDYGTVASGLLHPSHRGPLV